MKNSILSLALFLVCTFALSAQAQTMSPSEAYLAYQKAVISASKPADYLSYYTAELDAKARALPAKARVGLMEMMKDLVGAEKDLKIVSETIKGSQATLKTTHCSGGKQATSDVSMVLEGTAWKVGTGGHTKISLKPCN